jgi:hypothetical protein
MPPRKSPQLPQNEGRIALAIQAYEKGQFRSLRAATTAYNVAYSTTYDRVKGRAPRQETRSTQHKLTQHEEKSLENWILSMDERGLPPRIDTVRRIANILLQKRSDESLASYAPVGKN